MGVRVNLHSSKIMRMPIKVGIRQLSNPEFVQALCKNCNLCLLTKGHPPLSHQPPSLKIWLEVQALPPAESRGGGAHYVRPFKCALY